MENKTSAVPSMICGIISVALVIFAALADSMDITIFGLPLGIVAIVLASKAKKNGCTNGIQKAGFVLGIIGTSLCGIAFFSLI